MVEQVSGKRLNIQKLPRRAGDPARVVADNQRIRELLNWEPQFHNLEMIVRHALAWEHKLETEKPDQISSESEPVP